MGIVIRESTKNAILTYLGLALGGIIIVFFVPKVFYEHPEQWGLIQLLLGYTQILVPLAELGIPSVIIKFLPFFREKNKPEFLSFSIISVTLGMIVVIAIFFAFRGLIFSSEEKSQELLINYNYCIVLMLIATVLYETLHAYSFILFKTSVPIGIKELLIRTLTFLLMLAYSYKIINFNQFVNIYVSFYFAQLLAIIGYLTYLKEFKITANFSVVRSPFFKEIIKYGLFMFLTTSTYLFVNRVDIVMIGHMLNLEQVAYYSVVFLIGTIIYTPARAIAAITLPLISENWKKNDLANTKIIYIKTAINQLIIGGFIFLIIWINADNIMDILGDKFGQAKYVLLFIGLGKLFDISTGSSAEIIVTSKYYRYTLYFQLFLLIITIILNLIFIPILGIEGAALSIAISTFIYSCLKWLFVYTKFKMQPFTLKTILAIEVLISVFLISLVIPVIKNYIVDIIIRSSLITIVYGLLIYHLKLSDDINGLIKKVLQK